MKWSNTSNHWSKTKKREETLKKISENSAHAGGRPVGIPSDRKGKPLPWAAKAADARRASGMYKRMIGNKYGSHIPWNKGKPHALATRSLISLKLKGRKVWNTGIGIGSPLGTAIRRHDKYVEWRTAVFVRDDYRCQMCGKRGYRIHADHIKPFAQICKEYKVQSLGDALSCSELWDINNGRTLCVPCHRKTDTFSGKQQTKLYKFPRS